MERFARNDAKAKDHMVIRMCVQAHLYQVDTLYKPMSIVGGQHTHKVNLQEMTCTCRKWTVYKIPCLHVIAVCAKYKHVAQ